MRQDGFWLPSPGLDVLVARGRTPVASGKPRVACQAHRAGPLPDSEPAAAASRIPYEPWNH